MTDPIPLRGMTSDELIAALRGMGVSVSSEEIKRACDRFVHALSGVRSQAKRPPRVPLDKIQALLVEVRAIGKELYPHHREHVRRLDTCEHGEFPCCCDEPDCEGERQVYEGPEWLDRATQATARLEGLLRDMHDRAFMATRGAPTSDKDGARARTLAALGGDET